MAAMSMYGKNLKQELSEDKGKGLSEKKTIFN